jgi:monoamine oxidase
MAAERVTDAVVVGAGLSGLAAARTLADAGCSVVVLEARDRVGGRTWSEQIGGAVFDVGGQWIGPTQHRMARLVEEFRLATFPTYHDGKKVLDVGGKLSTYAGTIPSMPLVPLLFLHRTIRQVERLCRTVPREAPWAMERASDWDGVTVESWKRRTIPQASVRAVFEAAVRVVFGSEPSELSLLHFLWFLNCGGGFRSIVEIENGAQQTRFVLGAQEVSRRLAARLGDAVVLGAPARAIAQDAGGVTVHADGRSWQARRAIVAVPPTMAGRIGWEPALPYLRDQLTQRAPMGATVKVLATYERPFWRTRGFSGEAVSTGGPLTATFDNTSHDGAEPALLGFIVGRPAREWAARPADERRATVLAALARFFGAEAARPVHYREQDWSLEPWTRGCPVTVLGPGVLGLFGPALATPVGRVHWAGTETSTEWTGYMEGAVASGERAAREVLERRNADG